MGNHPAKLFSHADCDTDIDDPGRRPQCGTTPTPEDLIVRPGPGYDSTERTDAVTRGLQRPHRLLTPVPTTGNDAAQPA